VDGHWDESAVAIRVPWCQDLGHGSPSLTPHIRFFGNVGSFPPLESWLVIFSFVPCESEGISFPSVPFHFGNELLPIVIVEPMIRRVPLIPRTNNGLGDFELEHIP
jgi:hypothetical protein